MIFYIARVFLKIGEIIDICVETDVIKKSGSWFSYGETKLGQGKEAVKKLLEDNPELLEELESKILNSINCFVFLLFPRHSYVFCDLGQAHQNDFPNFMFKIV